MPCYTRHPISLMRLQKNDYIPKAASNLLVISWHCPADRGWCHWWLSGRSPRAAPSALHTASGMAAPAAMGDDGLLASFPTLNVSVGKTACWFLFSPEGKIAMILPGPCLQSPGPPSCACRGLHSARLEFPQKSFPGKTLMFCICPHLD